MESADYCFHITQAVKLVLTSQSFAYQVLASYVLIYACMLACFLTVVIVQHCIEELEAQVWDHARLRHHFKTLSQRFSYLRAMFDSEDPLRTKRNLPKLPREYLLRWCDQILWILPRRSGPR